MGDSVQTLGYLILTLDKTQSHQRATQYSPWAYWYRSGHPSVTRGQTSAPDGQTTALTRQLGASTGAPGAACGQAETSLRWAGAGTPGEEMPSEPRSPTMAQPQQHQGITHQLPSGTGKVSWERLRPQLFQAVAGGKTLQQEEPSSVAGGE